MKLESVDEATDLLKRFKNLSDFLANPPNGASVVSYGAQSVTIVQASGQLLLLVQAELDAVQKRLKILVAA